METFFIKKKCVHTFGENLQATKEENFSTKQRGSGNSMKNQYYELISVSFEPQAHLVHHSTCISLLEYLTEMSLSLWNITYSDYFSPPL